MKIHRNLVFLQAEPAELDRLQADSTLAKLLVARPAPGLCAIRPEDHDRLMKRLDKLGLVPRVVGSWR